MSKCFLLFETIIQLRPVLHDLKSKSDIILGAINKEAKNSKETLETWKSILHKTNNTKILIKLDGIDNVIERKEYYKKVLNITIGNNKTENFQYNTMHISFNESENIKDRNEFMQSHKTKLIEEVHDHNDDDSDDDANDNHNANEIR